MPAPYPCRLFLFDLDGTLIDSREDIARGVNAVLARMGLPRLAMPEVIRFVGDGMEALMDRVLRDVTGAEPDEERIRSGVLLLLEEYGNHLLDATRLYPGVRETIADLHWAKLGLVSNKPEALTRRILSLLGLADRFCSVLGGDSLPQRKPDPAPILAAVLRCHGAVGETVMVGDSPSDIVAGKRAGVITCAITSGYRSREELSAARPDVLIDRMQELLQFFCVPAVDAEPPDGS